MTGKEIVCDECGLYIDDGDICNHAYETGHIKFIYTGVTKRCTRCGTLLKSCKHDIDEYQCPKCEHEKTLKDRG